MRADPRSFAVATGALLGLCANPLQAYVATGAWPTGNIAIELQLDGGTSTPALPSGGLADGSASWNAAIRPAIDAWNAQMTRCQLAPTVGSSAPIAKTNGRNNVFFSSTYYGAAFGSRTLAVTLVASSGLTGAQLTETDLVVNTAVTWDSYRGAIRNSPVDLRRVAEHELGHVLGLDHPNEDDPPQTVAALMNSTVSNVETLQPDDIAGVRVLYTSPVTMPTITRSPQNQTVTVGGAASLSLELGGAAAPASTPTQQYAWLFTPTGGSEEDLFTLKEAAVPLGAAQTSDAGAYRVVVETPNGSVTSSSATLTVNPVTATAATRLINLSTRAYAGSGDRTLIVGFVITGNRARRILLRAVGPTLGSMGVTGMMPDPALNLVNASSQTIATNNDWGDNGGAATLPAIFQAAGAFALPAGSRDAALVANLPPGLYTALVSANAGTAEGIALVEAYDIDDRSDPTSRLINLSTRGYIGTDANIMIAGLVVAGPGPRTYLVRGAGDSLQSMGVSGTLDDPTLKLFDAAANVLRFTDDWDSPSFLQPTLQQTFQQVGAFVFTDRQEAAMKLTLNPGIYTLHLTGFNRGTGVGLVEVYEVSQ